jgi:hypothetical protein
MMAPQVVFHFVMYITPIVQFTSYITPKVVCEMKARARQYV